jgi:prolyl-tRNA synthetase
MRMRNYLFKSKKTIASDIDPVTARMMKGCFIKQQVAGVFQFTNLGLRLLRNVETVIRKYMDEVAQEVRIPILQDKDTWKETERDKIYSDTMLSLKDRKGREFCLAPTSEEYCVKLVEHYIESYKQLPTVVYQIGEKYRDELRCRFGLARSKQFVMKDAYSFACCEDHANEIYRNFYNIYCKIFREFGFETLSACSQPSEIGGRFAHEFLVKSQLGEDTTSQFREATEIESLEQLVDREQDAVNVIDTKVLKSHFTDESGKEKPFIMGCYGIGVSRIIALLFEKNKFFRENLAPFKVHIIVVNLSSHIKQAEEIYKNIKNSLLDDRDKSLSEKISDAELIMSPIRVIVGSKIEIHDLSREKTSKFDIIKDALDFLKNL